MHLQTFRWLIAAVPFLAAALLSTEQSGIVSWGVVKAQAQTHAQNQARPSKRAAPSPVALENRTRLVEFENAPAVLGQIRSGELKAIAVGTAKRSAILPELPTIADTVPGYESSSWLGLLAPAATPRPIIERLNAAINKALEDEAIRKRLDTRGVERVGGSAEAFRVYLRAKVEETDKIAKAAGLRPE